MVYLVCVRAWGSRRGVQASGAAKRQPAWLLGGILMYEELSAQKRLFNNLSIKL